MDVYGVIYKITNKINGKVYIGLTTQEYVQYINSAYKNKKGKGRPKLFNAIDYYKWSNFTDEIIYELYSKEDLDLFEDACIAAYDSVYNGYNCKDGGSSGKHLDKTKEKMSISQTERYKNPEARNKLSVAQLARHKNIDGHKAHVASHNTAKSKEKRKNANRHKMMPCICIQTGQVFENINEASRVMGLYKGNISQQLRGKRTHVGGYVFRYF